MIWKQEEMEKQKTRTLDMTQGSLWKNIFLFSMPLVLAQLLEVMFNLSDVAVVGQFADYRALGAVGSTTILVTLFTGFLIGMGSGVNVQVALGLGAKDDKTVEKTIHTAFLICAAIGIVIGVFCILFARPMLQALHTKSDLIDAAVLYLKIYALGMPAMAVYNFGNGVLSAKGDTKSPLIYLAVAGVPDLCHRLSSGSGGCCHCKCDRAVCFHAACDAQSFKTQGCLQTADFQNTVPSGCGKGHFTHGHSDGIAECDICTG